MSARGFVHAPPPPPPSFRPDFRTYDARLYGERGKCRARARAPTRAARKAVPRSGARRKLTHMRRASRNLLALFRCEGEIPFLIRAQPDRRCAMSLREQRESTCYNETREMRAHVKRNGARTHVRVTRLVTGTHHAHRSLDERHAAIKEPELLSRGKRKGREGRREEGPPRLNRNAARLGDYGHSAKYG